jgi:hypothetical protein
MNNPAVKPCRVVLNEGRRWNGSFRREALNKKSLQHLCEWGGVDEEIN